MLAAIAEFERELIRERTGEGRKRAMAAGVKFGRKPKLSEYQRRRSRQTEGCRRNPEIDRQILCGRHQHDLTPGSVIRQTPRRAWKPPRQPAGRAPQSRSISRGRRGKDEVHGPAAVLAREPEAVGPQRHDLDPELLQPLAHAADGDVDDLDVGRRVRGP